MSAWGDRGTSRSDREVSTADGAREGSAMTIQSSAKSVTVTDKEIFLSQLTHEILHLTEQQKTPHQTQALDRCGHKNVPRHKNEPRNTQWWEVSVSDLLKSQGEELSFNAELKKNPSVTVQNMSNTKSHALWKWCSTSKEKCTKKTGRADSGGKTPEAQCQLKASRYAAGKSKSITST